MHKTPLKTWYSKSKQRFISKGMRRELCNTFVSLGFEVDKESEISRMCAVFVKAEVISLIAKKESVANITYAVHESIAPRLLASMVRKFAHKNKYTVIQVV